MSYSKHEDDGYRFNPYIRVDDSRATGRIATAYVLNSWENEG